MSATLSFAHIKPSD